MNVINNKDIITKLNAKKNSTNSFYIEQILNTHSMVIANLKNMEVYEKAYNNAKDMLVNELPYIMRETERFMFIAENDLTETQKIEKEKIKAYSTMLTNNIDKCIDNIKFVYQDAQSDVDEILTFTGLSELNFEKEYVFELSKDKTENTMFTALKLIEQYIDM